MKNTTNSYRNSTSSGSQKRYIAGIAIFLLIEFLARIVFLPANPASQNVWRSILLEWVMFLFLFLFWIPRIERERYFSIGLDNFRFRQVIVGILAYIIAFIPISILGYFLSTKDLPTLQSSQTLLSTYSLPTLLGLVATGVILEEFLYRGYLIERLSMLTGKTWPALLASFLLFTLVHWRFVGFYPMLQIGIMSAVLVALYARERSVWPCSVMHGINSIMVYLLFPLMVS